MTPQYTVVRGWMISAIFLALFLGTWSAAVQAQSIPLTSGPVLPLYRALRDVGLDPQRVFQIREAEIDREDIHMWLNDGTIAFTQSVDGKVTGAFFEGDGEVLVRPPDRMERASLGRFIGAGVLEEKFSSAYLRFNDDTASESAICGPQAMPQLSLPRWVPQRALSRRPMPCGCAFRLPVCRQCP